MKCCITRSYMIDNIILLITGSLHQRPISELVTKCHPLGSFEQMEAINVASTPAELYNAVLIDTPLGEQGDLQLQSKGLIGHFLSLIWLFLFAAPFFESCINEQDLDEMNIEIIRNTLYKSYLESFFNFCKQIGGETEEVMCEILAVSNPRLCSIKRKEFILLAMA